MVSQEEKDIFENSAIIFAQLFIYICGVILHLLLLYAFLKDPLKCFKHRIRFNLAVNLHRCEKTVEKHNRTERIEWKSKQKSSPMKMKKIPKSSSTQIEIFTDHNVINFELLFHPKRAPKIQRTVYDYRRGDFTALRSALESLNLSATISADGDINDDWRNWRNTFVNTVSHHIPSTKIRGRNYVPWMNSTILHNIKTKNFFQDVS
jgi:hypothetical protein